MHRGSHPRSSVDRKYISRAQVGKGLLIVKDCVDLERSDLFDYAANSNKKHLKVATEELRARIKKNERITERQHRKRKHCMVNS